MKMQLIAAALASGLAGCSAPERVILNATDGQQSIVRDGIPALISTKKHIVMLRPNARQLGGNSRPAFTIVVRNQGSKPETFLETGVRAQQKIGNQTIAVRVFSYDELVQEETDRQRMAAVGAALAAAGRGVQAANAGYTTTTGTIHGPYGTSSYVAQGYDPARAQAAQSLAAAETQADIDALRSTGERNLTALENTILKDNTVMPGEWYGGTIVLSPPLEATRGGKSYSISIRFGGEEHKFAVSQIPKS